MAILHIIRCDGPECRKEQPLTTSMARHPNAVPEFTRPHNWHQADGKDFCSYECLGAYGKDRAEHPEKYESIGRTIVRLSGPW